MAQPDRNDLVRGLWDLSLLSESELTEWKGAYQRFMQKVTLGDPRQLVVKSPANTLRIPLLRSMYPDAKFIYIYRNPLDVFHSTVHMRKAMFRENSLGIPQLTDIEDAVYWLQEYTHRTYERDKRSLPAGALHEVRFETLEQDPVGELRQAYTRLGLEGWDKLEAILLPQVPALRRYQKNEFKYSSAEVDACYNRLQALLRSTATSTRSASPQPPRRRSCCLPARHATACQSSWLGSPSSSGSAARLAAEPLSDWLRRVVAMRPVAASTSPARILPRIPPRFLAGFRTLG